MNSEHVNMCSEHVRFVNSIASEIVGDSITNEDAQHSRITHYIVSVNIT